MTTFDAARVEQARQRAAEMRAFYTNLTSFLVVSLGAAAFTLLADGGHWIVWVLLLWGIGLLLHGVRLFGPQQRFDAAWEARKTEELLQTSRR